MSARHPPPVRHPTTSRWCSSQYARLIKLCRARGCNREDAQELVQEAHRRLFEYRRFVKVRHEDSLLRRIVINLSITHYHRVLSAPYVFESVDKLDRRGILIDPAAGPERTVAAEQELDGVVNLVSVVSERTCQIFMAHRGGYSYEEIAIAFAIKPRTIEKHVATATARTGGITESEPRDRRRRLPLPALPALLPRAAGSVASWWSRLRRWRCGGRRDSADT